MTLTPLERELRDALRNFMQAVFLMNMAMRDGGNVHGALSTIIGCEDMAYAALARAEAAEKEQG